MGTGAASLAMLPATASDGACPTAPSIACVLDDGTAASSYTVVSIECTIPPGAGTDWKMSIRGYWVELGPRVGFAAPVITSVAPLELPMAGGQLTIAGANFGRVPCASAGPSRVDLSVTRLTGQLSFNTSSGQWGPTEALVRSMVPCNITTWSSDSVACAAPPGLDGEVTVRVVVGGQAQEASGLLGYTPPTVVSFATAGKVGTAGGVMLSIIGSGFPDASWPLAVAVGAQLCAIVPGSRASVTVSCTVPRGWGRQAIVVHTPLQASLQPAVLQYDAPVLTRVVTPHGRPVQGGFLIEVHGEVGSRYPRPCALDACEIAISCFKFSDCPIALQVSDSSVTLHA